MLSAIFKAVSVMSAVASVTALALYALKPLARRLFGIRWQYYGWYLVLIAAVVPLSFSFSARGTDGNAGYDAATASEVTVLEPQMTGATDNFVGTAESDDGLPLADVLSFIWLAVAICRLTVAVCGYHMFLKSALKKAVFCEKRGNVAVYKGNIASAPVAVGVFKKRIFLPDNISDSQREYILRHELMHFKHRDTAYKWLCMVVKCIHWFNPVMYLVSRSIDEECELYCDASVTCSMSDTEKTEYMNVILSLISYSVARPMTTAMANSRQSIIRRFSIIRSYRRKGVFAAASGMAAMALLLVITGSLSGIAGGEIYDGTVPAISINFLRDTSDSRNFVFLKGLPDNIYSGISQDNTEAVFSGEEQSFGSDADVEDNVYQAMTPDEPKKSERLISYSESAAAIAKAPKQDMAGANRDGAQPTDLSPEKPANASDKDETGKFFKENNSQKMNEMYDGNFGDYPYSGSIKYDGLTMDSLTRDIEKSGMVRTTSDNADLKNSYISDTLTYQNGGVSEFKGVSCDEHGNVAFYMDSEYDQHIEISFVQDGKQVAGYGIIPDNETTYVFGGFDPNQTYDITVSSSTGSTWMVENEYLIY